MTDQAQPGRPPAHDLSTFDLSRRSPEQIALSFARWKAQRKRQAEAACAEPLPGAQPAVEEKPTGDTAPGEAAAAPKRVSARQTSALRYSAPFSDLLAAGSEPAVQRTDRPPVAAVPPPHRTASPGHRLKVMSILAGAASVFALAGGALLELGDWRNPAEVAPPVAHVRPPEIPAVGSLATAASSAPESEWSLRRTVDMALMKAVPPAPPTAEPPAPAIQTASKPVSARAGDKPVVLPERKSAAPETVQFVAKPYVPNVAPTPARVPAAPIPAPPVAAAIHAGDPRPDDLFQHGRDSRNGSVSNRTVNNRSTSGGKPAAASGMGSAVDARSASARSDTAASGGSADPRGEGSGGARVGVAGEVGAPSDTGGDVSGGTSDAGDAGEDESGGLGAAVGGALDAVGDALGGGKGNPDSNDKDQRN